MKPGLDEIVLVLDRSSSMDVVRKETVEGVNAFLNNQRDLPGRTAKVTVVTFNENYTVVFNGVPIGEIDDFDEATYVPKGFTALWDAVGYTIDTVGQRLAETPEDERPEKVIVAIMTDGEENSSKEYTLEAVKGKIEVQREQYDWIFEFLAANIDVVKTAATMGIPQQNTTRFMSTPNGMRDVTMKLSTRYTSLRTG